MPFEIIRNDIVRMNVDAIVNTANPQPVIGTGVDSILHAAAGPQLLAARQKIGAIDTGTAAITEAYNLPAKYVIHTVGPVWQGGNHNEETLLRRCYENSLALAAKKRCRSIAFPLISTGNYGFPKERALQIATAAFKNFLEKHEMMIFLVVFDSSAFQLSEQLFQDIASYIDQHYVDLHTIQRRETVCIPSIDANLPCSMATSRPMSLEEMLAQEDAGFTETLLKLIAQSGKKDSDIYKKANLSKQHFSKIRSNPKYRPTKPTAIALALALELNLEDTRDLIDRAGYSLTNSSKFDLIIRYFIEHKIYDVVQINLALYEFDQPLLGN